MKLLAVIISLLILTTGCVAGEAAQPVVQPQIMVEQPTYQGITQYDYKAGPPNAATDSTTTPIEPRPPQPTSVQYINIGDGGGGSYSYWPSYYYSPPVSKPEPQPVTILSGSITVIITGE